MTRRTLIGLAVLVIIANVVAVWANVVAGQWFYTPVNVAALGMVVWALHRYPPRAGDDSPPTRTPPR
jgi:hypothetical protein